MRLGGFARDERSLRVGVSCMQGSVDGEYASCGALQGAVLDSVGGLGSAVASVEWVSQ